MEPREAINYLLDPIGKREMHDEAIAIAVAALEKQEAKKTMKSIDVDNRNLYRLYCPTCGEKIGNGNSRVGYIVKTYASQKHCGNCGQAIDWPYQENGS